MCEKPSVVWSSDVIGLWFSGWKDIGFMLGKVFSAGESCGSGAVVVRWSQALKCGPQQTHRQLDIMRAESWHTYHLSHSSTMCYFMSLSHERSFLPQTPQTCIKLIQSDSKGFLMLQKISISNKHCSFELSIHQRILKNKINIVFYQNIWQHNCFQHW